MSTSRSRSSSGRTCCTSPGRAVTARSLRLPRGALRLPRPPAELAPEVLRQRLREDLPIHECVDDRREPKGGAEGREGEDPLLRPRHEEEQQDRQVGEADEERPQEVSQDL